MLEVKVTCPETGMFQVFLLPDDERVKELKRRVESETPLRVTITKPN